MTLHVSPSTRPIKCMPIPCSQRGTKVNGSHDGDSPARCSNQQGSKLRQNPCDVQTAREHRELVCIKTMCIWVRSTASTIWSGVLPAFRNLNNKLQREDCLMCCPTNKVIKSDSKNFPELSEGYPKTIYCIYPYPREGNLSTTSRRGRPVKYPPRWETGWGANRYTPCNLRQSLA